jgi:hypothetical protein
MNLKKVVLETMKRLIKESNQALSDYNAGKAAEYSDVSTRGDSEVVDALKNGASSNISKTGFKFIDDHEGHKRKVEAGEAKGIMSDKAKIYSYTFFRLLEVYHMNDGSTNYLGEVVDENMKLNAYNALKGMCTLVYQKDAPTQKIIGKSNKADTGELANVPGAKRMALKPSQDKAGTLRDPSKNVDFSFMKWFYGNGRVAKPVFNGEFNYEIANDGMATAQEELLKNFDKVIINTPIKTGPIGWIVFLAQNYYVNYFKSKTGRKIADYSLEAPLDRNDSGEGDSKMFSDTITDTDGRQVVSDMESNAQLSKFKNDLFDWVKSTYPPNIVEGFDAMFMQGLAPRDVVKDQNKFPLVYQHYNGDAGKLAVAINLTMKTGKFMKKRNEILQKYFERLPQAILDSVWTPKEFTEKINKTKDTIKNTMATKLAKAGIDADPEEFSRNLRNKYMLKGKEMSPDEFYANLEERVMRRIKDKFGK